MTASRVCRWVLLLCASSAGMSSLAQPYPYKPVRIVTQSVGGGTDFVARVLAQGLTPALGQHVIVENRGSAVVPGDIVAKAPADGYTLLELANSFWLGPFLQSNVPYDPVRDFSPVSLVASSPQILVVTPALPVKTVRELIALAASKPGQLNYASGSTGGSPHLAAELFKAMAGVDIVRIPYQGSGPATTDLIAGRVQLTFGPAAAVVPHVASGKLRALAVTTAKASAVVPDLPTIAASGVPGYEAETLYGVFTPANSPSAVIIRLNSEIVGFLKTAAARERFLKNGLEALGSTPAELGASVKSEIARMKKLIQDNGIRAE